MTNTMALHRKKLYYLIALLKKIPWIIMLCSSSMVYPLTLRVEWIGCGHGRLIDSKRINIMCVNYQLVMLLLLLLQLLNNTCRNTFYGTDWAFNN